MEKMNVLGLYSSFKKGINKKPYQIIKTLKSLTISDSYSNFYRSATNIFQIKTFKLPERNQYPIIRKSQSKYLSLKSKLKTFSFNDKKETKKFFPLSPLPKKSKAKKDFYIGKTNKNKIHERNKKINFFICEKNYGGKYHKLFTYKHFRSPGLENKKNHPPDFYRNFKNFKIYPVEEIKTPEERIKNFFNFLNTIFIKESYNSLKYEESEIFGHKEDYYDYIKDEFTYFFQKEKEVDKKSFLYSIFKTKDYGKVEIFLKSARIDVIDESLNKNNVKLSISVPFSLMCLIYLINMEQINNIIFFLLNKVNISEKNTILSEEESKNLFLEVLSKIKYEDDNVFFDIGEKNNENYLAKIFYLEKIQLVSETIRYNYFLSDFNKKKDVIKIIDNIRYEGNYINKRKIIFNNNINQYKILLLSQNNNNKYKIKFSMPEISMLFNDYEKQLNYCINKELFIYLYQNNFMDWDFYILHYLFFQKNFRLFISKALSLNSNFDSLLSKNIINLDDNKIDFNTNEIIDLSIIKKEIKISKAINNAYKRYYLSNFYNSKIIINENDIEFLFSFLIDNNINICKFKSYTLFAFINNINKPKIYEFHFSFSQMRILYFRSQYKNFHSFLKRLIYIKDGIINFDYSYFKSFYSMTNNEIIEYFYKLNLNSKEEKKDEGNIRLNLLILKLREPYIEIMSKDIKDKDKDTFAIAQFHIELNKDFLKVLINNKVSDWIKIIEENKDLFKSSNYIKYEESKVKRIKRKNLIKKGKKNDFQSAFMRFLLSSKNISIKK